MNDIGLACGFSVYDSDYSLVLQGDKIVAAGNVNDPSSGGSNFVVSRYNSDGTFDTSFNGTGRIVTDFRSSPDDGAYALKLQDDGKLVVAGVSRGPSTTETRQDFALIRYNASGSLDATFGTGGRVWSDFGGADSEDVARSLAIDGNGRIVAAGFAGSTFALARYLPGNRLTVVAPVDPGTISLGEIHATTVSAARIDVRWEAHYLANVTYNVYRSTTPDFRPGPNNQIASGLTTSSFSDTTVAPSTRYYYLVTAITSAGESFESDVGSQATGFDAQPLNLSATTVDEYSVELTWSDVSANETGFTVEKSTGGAWTTVEVLSPDSTGTLVGGLDADTSYSFRVSANFPGVQVAQGGSGPTVTRRTGRPENYRGLVVAINGDKHGWDANPASSGIRDLIERLRAQGFRVYQGVEFIFAGPNIKHDGKGSLFNSVVSRLQRADIANVAVFGYSHGADLARKFVNRLSDVGLPVGTVTYTAYIDAIERGPFDLWYPAFAQTLRPYFGDCDCTWHDNFYQFNTVLLRGNRVPTADQNYKMEEESHFSIDDNEWVKSEIIRQVNNRVII
jgi:uncharacterized delta-60 repeat protein